MLCNGALRAAQEGAAVAAVDEKDAQIAALQQQRDELKAKAKLLFEKLTGEKQAVNKQLEEERAKNAKLQSDLTLLRDKAREKVEQLRDDVSAKDAAIEQLGQRHKQTTAERTLSNVNMLLVGVCRSV